MPRTYPLFIMFSQTDTYIGKTIRAFTHYEYNHVSLTLDPTFAQWVSFARYVRGVPLAGGFVVESADRFLAMHGPVNVKIYRIDLSAIRYRQLQKLFQKAGNRDSGLLYNTFDIAAAILGRKFPLPGAYTCLDFACTVLGRQYSDIQALDRSMATAPLYQGDLKPLLPSNPAADEFYFARRGFLRGTRDSAVHFSRLFCRFLHRASYTDPVTSILCEGTEKQ